MPSPTEDKQRFENSENPYKRMWHRLIIEIISSHDPTDVVGMQNNPIMKKAARIEKEELFYDGESKPPAQ